MKRIATILVLCVFAACLSLGVESDNGNRNITVSYGVNLNVNGSYFMPTDVNGKSVPAFIYDGTTYVPIRAISELYGADVAWDGFTNTVSISYKDYESLYYSTLNKLIQSEAARFKAENQIGTETSFNFPYHLFSNDGKTYLGKCVTDEWDSDGIYYALIGDYSSTVARNSIWNSVGTYGSSVSDQSAFNNIAQHPPMIVDNNGQFIAYLTTNTWITPGWTISTLRMFLENNGQ